MAAENWGDNDKLASVPGQDWGASDKEVRPEPPARGFGGWARDAAAWAVKGAVAVPEAVVGLADIPTGGRVGKFLENADGAVGFRPKQAREAINDWHSDATKEAQRKFEEAEGIGGKFQAAIENPSNIVGAVVESLPSIGAGGVVARGLMGATRLGQMGARGATMAGAIGEGVTMAGGAAEQIRQETDDGLLTPEQGGAALATGALGTLFGYGGGKLAQRLGIGDVETMVAQGARGLDKQLAEQAARAAADPAVAKQMAKSVPRQVIEGAITEGLFEELPQSVSEQLLQNLALGKDWHEDLDAAIVLGALSGAAMGAGASGYRGLRSRGAPEGGADGEAAPIPSDSPGDAPPPSAGGYSARGFAPVLDGDALQRAGVTPPPVLDAGRLDAALGEAPVKPSEAMGLDPQAGPLSAGAALAVDSGATEQLRSLRAAAQVAEAVQATAPAARRADPETGEVAPPAPASADPVAALQERLQFVQQQAQAGGWDKQLIAERNRVQRELAQLRREPGAVEQADSAQPASEKSPAAIEGEAQGAANPAAPAASTPGESIARKAQAIQAGPQQQEAGDQAPAGRAAAGAPQQVPAAAAPAGADLQAAGLTEQAQPVASARDAAGFLPVNPDGYRVRISQHQPGQHGLSPSEDHGAILYETRKGAGDRDPLDMVVGKNGRLIQSRDAVRPDNTSSGVAWVPPSQEAANRVISLLEQRASTKIGSSERKAIDAAIFEAVTGAPAAAQSGGGGVQADGLSDASTQEQIEAKTDEVMRLVARTGAGGITREQTRALIENKGLEAADRTIAALTSSLEKRARDVAGYLAKKQAAEERQAKREAAPSSAAAPSDDKKREAALARVNSPKGAFFMSQPKAQAFIEDNGLADTHELRQQNRAWHVVAKAAARNAKPLPQAQQTQAAKETVANAGPAKRKLPGKLAQKAAEAEAQRADYFTPGNVVKSYGGYDRVISYTPADERGNWSVRVRAVRQENGVWVDVPHERERTHATPPEAKELKAGPVQRAPAVATQAATETDSRPAQEATAAAPQQVAGDFLPEGWVKRVNGYTKQPVYRMEQGGGQPFAVVTQVEGMQYEVQIRHGDKQLIVSNQTGALSEVLAKAEAELTRMTQADSVTHQDPGEKAEAATPGVVTDSLKKAARNEDAKPSEMRKWLLAEIDKELLQAPDRQEYDEAVKRLGEKGAISAYTGSGPLGHGKETGFVTFDVPGDGKFKVRNSVRGLLEFRKNVSTSAGFKDGGQKRASPPASDGVQGGSGGRLAAITNMIEEGDFEAARDYAEAVGVNLADVKVPKGDRKSQWEKFLKDGTLPPPPRVASSEWAISTEQNANGTWSRIGVLKRTADGSEYVATVRGGIDGTGANYVITKDGKEIGKLTSRVPFSSALEMAEEAMPAANAQEASESPERFIKVAADSITGLRKSDVDRVLNETPAQFRSEVADYIRDQRNDLADEVDEVMADLIREVEQAAIERHGLPADTTFKEGKGLAAGKWVAQSGEASSNPNESIDAAAADLKKWLDQNRRAEDAEAKKRETAQTVAEKLRRGEQPTDAELKLLFGLEDGWTYVKQPAVGWFLVEYMGVPRHKIRASLGKAAGTVTSDSGTKYPIVYPRKLHEVFAEAAQAGSETANVASAERGAQQSNIGWDAMDADQRIRILTQPGGWATAKGGLNFIGKRLVKSNWGDILQTTRATIEKLAAKLDATASTSEAVGYVSAHETLMRAVHEGAATADQLRASFESMVSNAEQVKAELAAHTKDELLSMADFHTRMRYANEKKADVVDSVYRDLLSSYALGRTIQFGMGRNAYENALREMLQNTTQADIDAYATKVQERANELKAQAEARQRAVANPQTLEDFHTAINARMKEGKTRDEAYRDLTPEQRIRYDELSAEQTRERREALKAQTRAQVATAGSTTANEVIATKHTRDGHDLFVVRLADRVERDAYNILNASAKKLGGHYSSYRGNGAIPGFQFRTREAAEAFRKLVAGDTSEAQAMAQERRDAFADDKSQSAAERLREMADALAMRADAALNADRKVNTARRARMASAAEAAARQDKALAGTMRNVAEAIESGKAKFLDAVRQKVQVEYLNSVLHTAKDAQIRAKYPSYNEQEKHRGEPIDAETVDYARFPEFTMFRSDLAGVARQLAEVNGGKKLAAAFDRAANDVTDAYIEWAKANIDDVSHFSRKSTGAAATFASKADAEMAIRRSGLVGKAIVLPVKRGENRIVLSPSEAMQRGLWQGDGDKRINLRMDVVEQMAELAKRSGPGRDGFKLPWQLENALQARKRLRAMGIETPEEFRSALREFASLQEAIGTPDRIKQMERAMVGRQNDGLDFFPTSGAVVEQMLEAADIQEGMAVLEPSAGMGHISDAIRERTGVAADAVELSPSRRELLEAKGYELVGQDFLDLKEGSYDRIVMNPPFSNGRDIQHVQHAYSLLKPGGRIVAIMGESAFFNSNKRAEAFRDWLESVGGTSEKLPEGSFMDPSLPVNTAASARMVVIEKPEGDAATGNNGNFDPANPDIANFAANPARRPATGTPTDRAVMDMVREGRDARDILRLVAGTSKSRFNRQVARLLLKTGIEPKVLLAHGPMGGKDGFTFLAKYSRANNAISLTEGAQGQAEQIVLHEMVHAATLAALDRKGLHSLQMRRLFEHVKRRGGAAGHYGMKNVGEFVAEAFTNPEFQRALKSMDAPAGGTIRSAWDGFVRILRSILGLPQSDHSALSRALELGVAVMREDMALRQRGIAARGRDAQAGVDQTQTEAFKRWFGDSEVVDENGKPLVVYHGTNAEFTEFDPDSIGTNYDDKKGFFFTADSGTAEMYGDNVIAAYVSLQNPLVVDLSSEDDAFVSRLRPSEVYGHSVTSFYDWHASDLLDLAEDEGADGIIVKKGDDMNVIAFRPEQIKSATGNNGNFDPNDPDIAYFGAADMGRIKSSALNQVHQTLSHPDKVSLWDKTVGTMRHLAERSPAFKPVFEAAQRFIDDVAMLANDAADVAPRLLPRVDSWRDLGKKPISAADNKALARPLFEGTLAWARDVDGKPALVKDLQDKYRNLPADDKARMLLGAGKIDPGVLRMWRGLPLEQYEAAINSRFESQMLAAGVVWKDAELKGMFGLDDRQVSLYREARAAIDRSLDMTTRADMLRLVGSEFAALREPVLDAASLDDALMLMVDTLEQEAQDDHDQRERLAGLMQGLRQRADKARELMAQGYAPLSRFGRYTLDVVDASGERQYFGMFESVREANQMALRMRSAFPGAQVTQGTMSQQAYKMFAGITPESLELFGNMLGLESDGDSARDRAFQEYLRLTKNNHSSLKRLIHRKGIAGYSEDVGRVLASFIYSNARQGAGGLNAGTLEGAIERIPKEQGELKDVAMGLRSYIQDPQEEGQAVRGMLFAQYLGGSVASAFVNMTQPFAVTLPWMSQYGGIRKASQHLARALKDMGTRGMKYEADLAHALKQAEDDGIVSPQEIHQLMAQARGAGSLRAGDGTRAGEARAAAANAWEKVKVGWGQPFALAEQFNRRSTFIAAYRLARERGMADPAGFARHAVLETQFVYSKANKMRWGRGAVGGALMTFKSYSIQYLELMQRMWTQGGPEGRRAVGWAAAMLLLMGGAGGLPFVEDLEDVIDGAGQLMGYNVSAKQWRKQLLRDVLGKELGEFIDEGVSGLPGAPVDVSGRLGLGNLVPGTGLLLTKQSRERDLLEVAGPAGDLIARGFRGARRALSWDLAGAALEVSPTAVRNAAKGAEMAASGMYKDTKGYKVIDTRLDEALAKAAGFQPKSVAEVQEANSFMLRSKSFYIQTSNEIKAAWADALFNKDERALARVKERLASWNERNPEQPIVVRMPDVWKRVREMGKERSQRIADTAPKALRARMREEVAQLGA